MIFFRPLAAFTRRPALMEKQIMAEAPAQHPAKKSAATTKKRIEQAAAEQFARRGADGVTTREIAAASKISEGALYRHFESKAALAAGLFDAMQNHLLENIRKIEQSDGAPGQKIEKIASLFCTTYDETPAQLVYFLNALEFAGPPNTHKPPAHTIMNELERVAAKTGGDGASGKIKSVMAFGAIAEIIRQDFNNRLGASPEKNKPVIAAAMRAILNS